MKNTYFLFYLTFALLFSCKQPESPMELFKTSEKLKGEIVKLDQELIGMPSYDMALMDTLIFVVDRKSADNKCLFVIDVKNKTVAAKIAAKGWGPCEFSILTSITLAPDREKVFFQENNKRSIFAVNKDVLSSATKCPVLFTKMFDNKSNETDYTSICQLSDGRFLGLGPNNDSCMYALFDANGKRIASAFNFPDVLGNKKISRNLLQNFYYGFIKANPDKPLSVCVLNPSGFLEIIKTQGSKMESVKRISLQLPKCRYMSDGQGGERLVPDRSVIVGNLLLDTNKDFIYVGYSDYSLKQSIHGGSYARYLLVYDWTGKPIIRYELNYPVIAMSVSRDGKFIYGIAQAPDPVLVKYKLPD